MFDMRRRAYSYPTITGDLRLKPQAKTVLRHLRTKSHITPMQAMVVYSIARLAACIYEIREHGYDVHMELKGDARGHRYASYSLGFRTCRGGVDEYAEVN